MSATFGHDDILIRFFQFLKLAIFSNGRSQREEPKWQKPEALRWMTLKMKAHDGDVSLAKKFSH